MTKVLITGGAGFIGSNVALKLIEQGHEVTVLDSLSPQIHGLDALDSSPLYMSIKGRVNFIHGSICDVDTVVRSISGQDAIIHLAAETGTGQSMYEIKKYVDVNVGGTALLLDILANQKNSIKKFIVASSRAIYGEGKYRSKRHGYIYPRNRNESDMKRGIFDPLCPDSDEPLELVPTDEESKVHPTSIYGITKQNQEQMVLVACSAIGIAASALRYQNVYGPGQSLSNPYTGILSIFSTRIKNGNSLNIFEDGKESRDFVYIDDVVDATVLALLKDESNGQVFGIGSGVATNVLTVAQTLLANYGLDVPVNITGNFRLGDIRHNYADLTKARSLLGFEPKVSFEAGLKVFTDWVNSQDVKKDSYDKSIDEMKARGLFI